MERTVDVIKDLNGNKLVIINDIIFKGKRKIEWKDVKQYIRNYVGEFYSIADTEDVIYIGTDLPNEYAESEYMNSLKGAVAKAKAKLRE